MYDWRGYLAEIGRRGGIKSRRKLSRAQARAMVRSREAKRAARGAARSYEDTSVEARAVYERLLREMTPAEKLERVAALSRMVRDLSAAGARMRA